MSTKGAGTVMVLAVYVVGDSAAERDEARSGRDGNEKAARDDEPQDLVERYVLSDFAKSEQPWVDALMGILADNVDLLVRGQDASFQNKVHLAMVAKGFGDKSDEDTGPDQDGG